MVTQEELHAAERVLNQLDGHGPTTTTGDLRIVARAVLESAQRYEPVNERLLAACETVLPHIRSSACCIGTTLKADLGILLDDVIAAARAQAEEDAKPVDEAWRIKAAPDGIMGKFQIRQDSHGNWKAWVFDHAVLDVPTRGDLRRLLAALGITATSDSARHAAGITGKV